MRRYKFLQEKDIFETLNKVRDAFLAAKDGNQVNEIIDGLLTYDEKIKIGRRILIAEYLNNGIKIEEICKDLRVGKNTVMHISRRLEKYSKWFNLIEIRGKKVEREFDDKKYNLIGSSKLVFKTKKYTGIKKKDIKR
jgi:uncharacterized protein YerC